MSLEPTAAAPGSWTFVGVTTLRSETRARCQRPWLSSIVGRRDDIKRILKIAAFTDLLCGVLFYVWAAIIVRPLYRQVSNHNHLLNVGYACSQYVMQEHEFPTSVTDLFDGPRTRSVYLLKGDETDRWGHSIEIVPIDGSETSGFVISYGRDGIAVGEGFDADTSVRFAGIAP